MKTRYIIKATYESGIHAGESFYLIKGGHVVDPENGVLIYDTYSLRACKAVCERKTWDNFWLHALEEQECEQREREGRPQFLKYPLYELKSYEPFAIEYAE